MTEPNWDRWHALLDIRDRRGFSPEEEAEYERFQVIVAKLDAEEAAIAAPGLEALVAGHGRVLESIRKLTVAVRAKCDELDAENENG